MKVVKIVSPQFHAALMKLSNQELPLGSAKIVFSTVRTVKELTEDYHNGRIEFMSKLAEQNEDGTPKLDEKDNFILSDEVVPAINEKLKEMLSKEIEIKTIPLVDLGDAKLSAQEFSLLEELFV